MRSTKQENMSDRTRAFLGLILAIGCFIAPAALAQEAEDLAASLSNDVVMGGSDEPPRLVRAEGWEWERDVRVWLPGNNNTSDTTYPLALHFRMFPGEDHLTVIPIACTHGVRALWGE
jgi:hypothetical protein